jgi:hypothetical protein
MGLHDASSAGGSIESDPSGFFTSIIILLVLTVLAHILWLTVEVM